MVPYEATVCVDFHQFCAWDPTVTSRVPDDYTEDDVTRMVKLADGVVVVNPVRNGDVAVEVSIADSDPGYELDECDHAVECSVALSGGQLQVQGCLDNVAIDVSVVPGSYQVRVLFQDLDRASYDGAEGDELYRVQLWPGPPREIQVIKAWSYTGEA